MGRLPRGISAIAVAVLSTVATTARIDASGLGQSRPAAGEQAPPASPEATASDDVIVTLADIGLEVRLPAGTLTNRRDTPNGTEITAVDGSAPPSWSALIRPFPASVDPPLPRPQLAELIATRRPGDAPLRRLDERRIEISGRLGHMAILEDPTDRPDRFVGLAVFSRDATGRAMVLVSARGRTRAALEGAMDRILAGVRVRTVVDLGQERGERLAAGEARLAGIDRAALESLIGEPRWYRTYRLDTEGREVELGALRVEVFAGLSGVVNPNRDPDRYSLAEREPGIVVRAMGRVPERGGTVRTSMATHWMAWDQSSEQWSVVATVRNEGGSNSETLTGVRAPRTAANPRGSITMVVKKERGASDVPAMFRIEATLLPQPIRWLLAEALVATDPSPGVMAWYWTDTPDGRPALTYREDAWRADPNGGYILESRLQPASPPIVSRHDERGRLVIRVTPDGVRTVPIELADLRKIWASKGIPTGPLSRGRGR